MHRYCQVWRVYCATALKRMLHYISSPPDIVTTWIYNRCVWLRVIMLYDPQSIYTSTASNLAAERPVAERSSARCVSSSFPQVGWFPWASQHAVPLYAHPRCQDPLVTASPQYPQNTTHAASPAKTNELILIFTPTFVSQSNPYRTPGLLCVRES